MITNQLKFIYHLVFVGFLIAVLSASLSKSFVQTKSVKQGFMHWLPQGWAFFTRDPREELVAIYRWTSQGPKEINIRNGSTEFLFGLNREGRVRGYEVSQILANVPLSLYDTLQGNAIPQLDSAKATRVHTNKQLQLFENGYYLIKAYQPLPWAWINKGQEKFRKFAYQNILLSNEP